MLINILRALMQVRLSKLLIKIRAPSAQVQFNNKSLSKKESSKKLMISVWWRNLIRPIKLLVPRTTWFYKGTNKTKSSANRNHFSTTVQNKNLKYQVFKRIPPWRISNISSNLNKPKCMPRLLETIWATTLVN